MYEKDYELKIHDIKSEYYQIFKSSIYGYLNDKKNFNKKITNNEILCNYNNTMLSTTLYKQI